MEEAAKEAAKVAEEAAKGQRRRSVVQGDTIMMEERKPKSGCNDMAFHCWECCGGTLLFLGAIAGIVYLTHLVVSSDENPGSSLSPPSSPPQPLLPPSALPSPHYLSSLAVGLIGGGDVVLPMLPGFLCFILWGDSSHTPCNLSCLLQPVHASWLDAKFQEVHLEIKPHTHHAHP